MTTLTVYDGRFARLKEERDNIIKAKEALELAEPGTPLLSPLSLPSFLPPSPPSLFICSSDTFDLSLSLSLSLSSPPSPQV